MSFLAERRREVYEDAFIADLFPSDTGRPSLSADLVGTVLILKELFSLSDRQQPPEAVMFDLRWKVTCGLSLTATSFDPTTLVYWRRRIAAASHCRPQSAERVELLVAVRAQLVARTHIDQRRLCPAAGTRSQR